MRIAVVGGGISGLALTHRLRELSQSTGKEIDVTLLEATRHLGGTIESFSRDGFLLEKGPDSFVSEKPWALDLARRLGLGAEIIGTREENRRSFVLRKGKLLPVPEGFYLISPTMIRPFLQSPIFSVPGKLRVMAEGLIPSRKETTDESIGSFIRRRFGREVLDRIGQAMLAGIYTGDPETLSLAATMPRFIELEKKFGSVSKGLLHQAAAKKNFRQASGPRYSLFLSFRGGMSTLTDALAERIGRECVKYDFKVKEVARDARGGVWRVTAQNGQVRSFDKVCLTTDASDASRMLKSDRPELSEALSEIHFESVLTLNVAYKTQAITHALDGFGFVTPRIENRAIIACTFCDQKFEGRAPEGFSLLRAFIGGAFGKSMFEKSDGDITRVAKEELKELLGISAEPLWTEIARYPEAMVQYQVGHLDRVSRIQKMTPEGEGLYLTGSSYRGVGISDCVKDAEAVADHLFKTL